MLDTYDKMRWSSVLDCNNRIARNRIDGNTEFQFFTEDGEMIIPTRSIFEMHINCLKCTTF